jgi:hypothetical protein
LSFVFEEASKESDRGSTIPINWNLSSRPLDMVIEAREAFGSTIFREIFITACWIIWLTRNSVIFYNGQINLNAWKTRFKEELGYDQLADIFTKPFDEKRFYKLKNELNILDFSNLK